MAVQETEVQSGVSALRVVITGWTSKLYGFLVDHLYVVLFVVFLVVCFVLFRKLGYVVMQKRASKYKIESTNSWFSWEDFRKYESEKCKK